MAPGDDLDSGSGMYFHMCWPTIEIQFKDNRTIKTIEMQFKDSSLKQKQNIMDLLGMFNEVVKSDKSSHVTY